MEASTLTTVDRWLTMNRSPQPAIGSFASRGWLLGNIWWIDGGMPSRIQAPRSMEVLNILSTDWPTLSAPMWGTLSLIHFCLIVLIVHRPYNSLLYFHQRRGLFCYFINGFHYVKVESLFRSSFSDRKHLLTDNSLGNSDHHLRSFIVNEHELEFTPNICALKCSAVFLY